MYKNYLLILVLILLTTVTAYSSYNSYQNNLITQLSLDFKSQILKMQSDMLEILGPYESNISEEQFTKFYCKYPENWNVDETFVSGNATAKFTAAYKYKNKIRQFTRGYLWGGNGFGEQGFRVLYGVDCSSFVFGIYNLAGACVPFYSSEGFYDNRNKYVTEIAIGKEQNGDIAWFSGHVGIVTDIDKHEFTWNGSTKDYLNYNGKRARIFRWKLKWESYCDIRTNAYYREPLYAYRKPPFCKD